MYGSRADIATPASDFTLALSTFGLMRVSSESVNGGALMQTGFAQTNNWPLDGNCSSSTLKIYYEFILPNILPGICGFLAAPGY